jgi:chemotaxis protein MotB
LITLLLGLFIILYAISNIDLTKYQKMMTAMGSIFGNSGDIPTLNDTQRDVITTSTEKLKDDLNTVIKRYHYDKSVTLEENERGVVLHILDDILFPSGQAVLNEQSKSILHQLALIIRDLPNDIRIEGHTDNVKINSSLYPSNWHLSVNRALNTAYYLMQSESLSPEKLSIVGYSEFKPLADNSSPEGRAKNRRVDIVIIK